MGEGTNRMIGPPADPRVLDGTDHERAPAKRAQLIEGEIDDLRDELGVLISELDRRRHEAMDVGLQVRRHAVPVALIGLGTIAAVGALIAWRVSAARERQRPLARARRLRIALERAADHPERVAAKDPATPTQIGATILTAIGTTAAIAITKKVIDRVMLDPAKAAHAEAAAGLAPPIAPPTIH